MFLSDNPRPAPTLPRLPLSASRRLLQAAAFFLAVLLASRLSFAQPGPGYVLVGEDENNYYYMKAEDYKGSQAEKLAVEFRRAKLAVRADQNALRNLGFELDSERFETFGEVAKEQKDELKKKILDALFDQALEATTLAARSAKSLNPWNVNKAIEALTEKGFKNEVLLSSLRKIAQTRDKPEMAAVYELFVKEVKAAKEGYDTGKGMRKDPNHAELRLILGALKCLQGNPELGLVVMGAEFGEHLAYLGYLSVKVGELSKCTDEKLASLAQWTQRLKGHVEEMKESRRAWQKATGHKTASPVSEPLAEKEKGSR